MCPPPSPASQRQRKDTRNGHHFNTPTRPWVKPLTWQARYVVSQATRRRESNNHDVPANPPPLRRTGETNTAPSQPERIRNGHATGMLPPSDDQPAEANCHQGARHVAHLDGPKTFQNHTRKQASWRRAPMTPPCESDHRTRWELPATSSSDTASHIPKAVRGDIEGSVPTMMMEARLTSPRLAEGPPTFHTPEGAQTVNWQYQRDAGEDGDAIHHRSS